MRTQRLLGTLSIARAEAVALGGTRHRRVRSRGARRRRGVVALELFFWLPVYLIALFAVVEIGLILCANQHVAFASRLGAKLAAEAAPSDLGTLNTSGRLQYEIDRCLEAAGYGPCCAVLLEHNVAAAGATSPQTVGDGSHFRTDTADPLPNTPRGVEAVRVTVCLPMQGNIPNCLSTVGFDLAGYTIRRATVWRYEHPAAAVEHKSGGPPAGS
jgi:Flp pilus assembly protein TadG